ncbi:MAG TPA: YceI family protein [Rhizomicrobium sp.]|jgi:polyisoprenoid-binding protein YceI
MKRFFTACAFLALVAGASQTYAAAITPVATDLPGGTYTLDKAHASLIVRLNHLGFSHFTARFTTFDVNLQIDPKHPENAKMEATIDPTSIASDNPPGGFLDELRGAQWLNAVSFPKIIYRATKIVMTGPNTARITGDLSLHGVTQPLVLDATFNGGYAGFAMDPHARIGFSAHGSFKRSLFGVAYGIPAPGTTMGVSDEVNVTIETEFTGPAWAGAQKAQ